MRTSGKKRSRSKQGAAEPGSRPPRPVSTLDAIEDVFRGRSEFSESENQKIKDSVFSALSESEADQILDGAETHDELTNKLMATLKKKYLYRALYDDHPKWNAMASAFVQLTGLTNENTRIFKDGLTVFVGLVEALGHVAEHSEAIINGGDFPQSVNYAIAEVKKLYMAHMDEAMRRRRFVRIVCEECEAVASGRDLHVAWAHLITRALVEIDPVFAALEEQPRVVLDVLTKNGLTGDDPSGTRRAAALSCAARWLGDNDIARASERFRSALNSYNTRRKSEL